MEHLVDTLLTKGRVLRFQTNLTVGYADGTSEQVNNYQRESSVYIRTKESIDALPFPNNTPSLVAPTGTSTPGRIGLTLPGPGFTGSLIGTR